MVSISRQVGGFTGITDQGSLDVVVASGPYAISVEADENLVPYILTEVRGNTLVVRFREDVWVSGYQRARVRVTAPDLRDLEVHGSGNLSSDGPVGSSGPLQAAVFGSGNLDLQVAGTPVDGVIHGSGNLLLSGRSSGLSATINGSGNVKALGLQAEQADVTIRGSGNLEVTTPGRLQARIFGSGDVWYRGHPALEIERHGSGSVSQAE